MPSIHYIGKDKVINHQREVPYKVLEQQYGFDAAKPKSKAAPDSGRLVSQGDNDLERVTPDTRIVAVDTPNTHAASAHALGQLPHQRECLRGQHRFGSTVRPAR